MATNYLTRSPGTPTSEKICTYSGWVKVNDVAGSIGLFAQTASSSGNGTMLFINSSSQLEFYATNGRVLNNSGVQKLKIMYFYFLNRVHV